MIRTLTLAALAALLACAPASAAIVAVGGTPLVLPLDEAYVSAKEEAPQVYDRMKATLSDDNIRLLDAYLTKGDAAQSKAGMSLHDTFYVFATLKPLEAVKVDARDWAFGRRVLAKSLGAADPNEQIKGADKRLSEHVSKEAGVDVKVEVGKVDKPTLYGDDPESVRFAMTIPLQMTVEGESSKDVLVADAAIAHVREKVLVVYVYRMRRGDDDARITRDTLASLLGGIQASNR